MAKYFSESESAILPHLYLQKRVISSFQTANEHLVHFNARDLSGQNAIIDGVTLSLSDIRDMTMSIYAEALKKADELFFHCAEFTIGEDEFIHDLPRCTKGGYGFLDDERNSWHSKRSLLEHVLSDPKLYDQFAYQDPEGKTRWKPGPCFAWKRLYIDIQSLIFILVVSSFGGTARGSEMWSTIIRNIPGGRMRNVFVLFNIFMLRGGYNKSSGMANADQDIIRIPLLLIGSFVIRFLAYGRPFFIELQTVFRPQMAHNATYFFYVGLDRPIKTTDFSLYLSRVYRERFSLRMSLGRLRQFYSFIMSQNRLLFPIADEVREDSQLFGHKQGQHDKGYSQHSSLPMGIATGKFIGTAEGCAIFQAMLGFPPDLLTKLHAASGWRNGLASELESIRTGRFISPRQQVIEGLVGTVSSVAGAITVDNVTRGLSDTMLPVLMGELNRRDAQRSAELIRMLAPQKTFPRGQALVKSVAIDIHPRTLSAFRRARGLAESSTEAFTGPTQAAACQLMLDGDQNFGYFDATGK